MNHDYARSKASSASELVDPSEYRSIPEAFQLTVSRRAEAPALRTQDGRIAWTWSDVGCEVERLAEGLHELGVRKGDTVAMIMANRPEHQVIDLAVLHLGGLPTSMYNTLPAEDMAWVLRDSGAKVAFVEARYAATLASALAEPDVAVDRVVVIDEAVAAVGLGVESVSYDLLGASRDPAFDFEQAWRDVGPEDLAVIIYTSGTTDRPKGVQHCHGHLLRAIAGYNQVVPLPPGSRLISAFPLAHLGERLASYYLATAQGHSVTFCGDIRQLDELYLAVKPSYAFVTPRSLGRFRSRIEAFIRERDDASEAEALSAAVAGGVRYVEACQAHTATAEDEARWQAAADLRKQMLSVIGLDQALYTVAGSAPVPPELLAYFQGLGLRIANGYGMTEVPFIARAWMKDRLGDVTPGFCGRPFPGTEIRIDPDGEILARSNGVMVGYRNRPDLTAAALDSDGWFRTGDLGDLNQRGELRLIGRKKEIIINANGKNMSPAHIETRVKSSGDTVGDIAAICDGHEFVMALVTLDPESERYLREQFGLVGLAWEVFRSRPEVRDAVAGQISRANSNLAPVERIRQWEVVSPPWEPGGVELTPTMKLKRAGISKRYADVIDRLHAAGRVEREAVPSDEREAK